MDSSWVSESSEGSVKNISPHTTHENTHNSVETLYKLCSLCKDNSYARKNKHEFLLGGALLTLWGMKFSVRKESKIRTFLLLRGGEK